MSSCESEDLEGFESAEEDLPVSYEDDTEDVVASRRKGLEQSLEYPPFVESAPNNEEAPTKPLVENDEVSTFASERGPSLRESLFLAENIKEFNNNANADITPNSAERHRLMATSVRTIHNTDDDSLLGSTKDSNKVSSVKCDVSSSGKSSVSSDVYPRLESAEPPKADAEELDQWDFGEGCIELSGRQEENSLSLLISSSAQKSIECVDIEADSLADGWDFEEEDIEIPDENPPSILSSAPCIRNVVHPEKRITGVIPLETDNSGIDNGTSSWDFDLKDLDHEEKEIKNIENINSNSLLRNTGGNDNAVWPSWGGWGVSNLIGTAGVSTLTQVTSGLSSMLENTLGAPDPEVLATQLKSKTDLELEPTEGGSKLSEHSDLTTDIFGLGNIIGGVKNLGNKVIDGGLETLETLGKKTMEVLQEGDPGLKKKRALLFQSDKVILSQVLRDAKEKAEASENKPQKLSRKAQYETLFDDFHGLVHLEALEMISRQCEIKMQTVLSNSPKCSLDEFNEAISLVKHLYEEDEIKVGTNEYDLMEEDPKPWNDDLQHVLLTCMDTLSLNVNIKHFLEVDSAIHNRLKLTFEDVSLIHSTAISDLAQFTACSIELFHRIAELFIVKDIKHIENDFKALSRMSRVSKYKIGKISENYCAKLILMPDKAASPLITNIFLEASNSSTYLDNAFELFTPILQSKALQNEISRN